MKRLSRNFFTRPSLVVAQQLLGKFLVRRIGKPPHLSINKCGGKKIRAGMIIETEAYPGPYDRASHAYKGKKTARNRAEYMVGGHIYIYLVYGMHWQLNISTGKEGHPECVLIRALLPENSPKDKNQADGPGKLCRWLKLNKSFYSEDLTKSKRFWVEDRGVKVTPKKIKSGPRVGIDYAGKYWSRRNWRFFINP